MNLCLYVLCTATRHCNNDDYDNVNANSNVVWKSHHSHSHIPCMGISECLLCTVQWANINIYGCQLWFGKPFFAFHEITYQNLKCDDASQWSNAFTWYTHIEWVQKWFHLYDFIIIVNIFFCWCQRAPHTHRKWSSSLVSALAKESHRLVAGLIILWLSGPGHCEEHLYTNKWIAKIPSTITPSLSTLANDVGKKLRARMKCCTGIALMAMVTSAQWKGARKMQLDQHCH